VPSASAYFDGANLSVFALTGDNSLNVLANTAGQIQVTDNGSPVTIHQLFGAASPTRANLLHIYELAGTGTEVLATDRSLDTRDSNNVLQFSPSSFLAAGNGTNTFMPGNGGIVGGAAGVTNGVVTGKVVGNSTDIGGKGTNNFISGPGNDTMIGGSGVNNYTWPPGTLTDTLYLGSGQNTITIIDGGNGNYTVTQPTANTYVIQRTTGVQFTVTVHTLSTPDIDITTGGTITGTLPEPF
jgi:hypothetical protein